MKDPDELKGEVKEGVGKLIEDDEMVAEGKADQTTGKVNDFIDSAADKAKKLADSIRDRVNKKGLT